MAGEHPLRVFVSGAAGADWTELTSGTQPVVRIAAPDLKQAQRLRARIQPEGAPAEVILDVTVLIAADFRSARICMASFDADDDTLHYAGTVEGLAGLIADIYAGEVADGVTLIAAPPQRDLESLADAVLAGIAARSPIHRAA